MDERVWDRFLSEQDRAHLRVEAEARGGDVPTGLDAASRARAALLLIDLYRWAFGDRPQPLLEATERWPGSCGLAGWTSLPHIQRLLTACRDAGLPVIHVTSTAEFPRRRRGSPRHRAAGEAHDAEARRRFEQRYEIVDEVAPADGEVVIHKAAASAFFGTPLIGYLRYLDVDTLVVAGESTSGCVRAAVVDARSYQFNVVVPEECVFDRHEAAHAMNLFDIHQKYADVMALDAVLAWVRAEPTAAAAE